MRRRDCLLAVMLCGGFLWPVAAAGQVEQRFEAEAGIGQLAEDTLLEARLVYLLAGEVGGVGCSDASYEAMGVCKTSVRVIAQLPLRFELIDESPSDDELVRLEDWDDPGDFFRIARLLEYGRPAEPLHARFGELGGVRVGHGTIVNGYANNIVVDDFRPGFEAHANSVYGGLHVVVDDVTAPHLLGGRGYVRPWGFESREAWWHRLAIGVTTVSDFRAPTELDTSTDGIGFRTAPAVEEEEPVTIAGLDVEASVVDEGTWRFLPYVDGNVASTRGVGGHAGMSLSFLPSDRVALSARLEGRVFSSGYLPDYFGPFYQVERYRTSGWGAPVAAPKARIAASSDGGYGGFGQLALSVTDLGSIAVAAAEHDGPGDTSYWARLSITPRAPVVFGAYVGRIGSDTDTLLDLDGTVLVSETRVQVWGPLYLHGHFDRLWQLAADGRYDTTTEWGAGAGASFPLGGGE